jgi:SPP1 gp7 family putative phage head morphogenesis protein
MALTNAQKRNAEKNRRYWAEREAEALKHYITEEKEYDKEIRRIHQNMLDACQKEIESFYAKYASAEGISLAEAKKRVSKLDIAAYERKAAKYVKEKNFSKKAIEEMRLYNATMKINRLELLKAQIGLETIAGHDELEKYMSEILQGRTEDELQRQAGILGEALGNNAKTASAIVNGSYKLDSFSYKGERRSTFSEAIWQHQELMREDLGRILARGMIQGKNPRALAKDIKQYWYGKDPRTGGGARYCAERLMRTELARVQTEAQKQSFERNDYEEYIFIVNGGCCPLCEAAAKKDSGRGAGVYYVKDMMPGENAPPMHPNCRCSTAAHMNRAEFEAWLDSLAKE